MYECLNQHNKEIVDEMLRVADCVLEANNMPKPQYENEIETLKDALSVYAIAANPNHYQNIDEFAGASVGLYNKGRLVKRNLKLSFNRLHTYFLPDTSFELDLDKHFNPVCVRDTEAGVELHFEQDRS